MLVMERDAFEAIHAWVEDVTVHGEAVGSSVVIRRHCTAKAIKLDLLVSVVELKDRANALYSLQVLILCWIKKVQGVFVSRISV